MMHRLSPTWANWILWLGFIPLYVLLDWASYLHAMYGLNITPWNPGLALGLVCTLRLGARTILPWITALLLSDILVRGLPVPLAQTLLLSSALAGGYWCIARLLQRNQDISNLLDSQKHLLRWLSIVSIGTLATSAMYIVLLLVFGLIPWADSANIFLRFWVGDIVGIIVTMPFLWQLLSRYDEMRNLWRRWETWGYLALSAMMLWVVFILGGHSEFQYFYLLFIPLVWAATKQGVAGAAICAFMLQAGIIIAVQWQNLVAVTVFELQMLGAALACVGLFIGVIVDEKQRISNELKQTLRLASAGEMAGALAHELNQPLTAISAYGMACEQLLAQGDTGPRLQSAIGQMVAESFRAADVVRRLKEFFRSGATQLSSVNLSELLHSASLNLQQQAQRQQVDWQVDSIPDCNLLIDRLQIEVVLRNLLSNALDAVNSQNSADKKIHIYATLDQQAHIYIADSGPGMSQQQRQKNFAAWQTSKPHGMGIGLTISRAIVEAHGGQLTAEPATHGLFKLSLPIETEYHEQ